MATGGAGAFWDKHMKSLEGKNEKRDGYVVVVKDV